MAEDVSKIVAFLAAYSEELVQLNKETLEALLKSGRAKHVKEWNAAKVFWYRKASTLSIQQREELDDREFVLCNMTNLESVAFLPRLKRCFQRVDSFLTERAEAIKKLACQNLETALERKHMLQFPMSTFTRKFLERYKDKLSTEQMEALSMWEENLCRLSAVDREAMIAKRVEAFAHMQEFLAKFAPEIVSLEKQNLRDVVVSNQAHKHAEWMQAKNFFLRQYGFLAGEEKELLEDWEFVLCNMSTLEPVAFLPRLQRCFQHVETFVSESAEALKKVAAKTIETALRCPQMVQFPLSTFTRIFLERYKDKLSTEQMEALSMWEENLCALSAVDREAMIAKRVEAFAHVQAFFAKFAAEIVELQKQTLRDVVSSHQAKAHAEWKQAKNFFARQYGSLAVEEKDLLEDWEFIVCNMSTLEPVAFLPRLQRCFQRVETFVTERAEALKKIAAKTIETALRRPQMAQFPTSAFTCVFLEKYGHQLAREQIEAITMWEENLCERSVADREAVTAKRVEAFAHMQEFLAKFAPEIVSLEKQNLRDVVMSNQAHKHAEWMQAKNFFLRQYGFLAGEEKALLEDWEFVLCNMTNLEPVAFLPRLQRCFQRVETFVTEGAEALKKIAAKTIETALRRPQMAQFPTSAFTCVFLEKYGHQLAREQIEAITMWEENFCDLSIADREAVTTKRVEAFAHMQEFLAKFAPGIVSLDKQNLRDVVNSHQANAHAEWMQAKNFFLRQYGFLAVEEKELLEDWEFVLCNMTNLEPVAFLPRLQRCFQRVETFVTEQSDQLKLSKTIALVDMFQSTDMETIPMSCFCAVFLKKYLDRVSAAQMVEVKKWEGDFCVTETELVNKFLEMLQRREAELKTLVATSVQQLFSGHRKKTDADLRFGYDFVRRSWTRLSLAEQQRVRQALEPFVHEVEQMPVKSAHEPK